jgi:DNA adenine methylase
MGLRLAGNGLVQHLVLADADPLVYAFWHTAAFRTAWLIDAIFSEPVTVDRWQYWREAEPTDTPTRAVKALFLNRTSFSGIMQGRAGPIGGRQQKSKYKIDCRFGVTTLERRLKAVGNLADSARLLEVWHLDWRDSLKMVPKRFSHLAAEEILVYLDPPYVNKSDRLYPWSFDTNEHAALGEALLSNEMFGRWVLSYDDAPLVRQIYPKCDGYTRLKTDLIYTASGGGNQRRNGAELLLTSLQTVPRSPHWRRF